MKPSAEPASTRHRAGGSLRGLVLLGCAAALGAGLSGCATEPRLELHRHTAVDKADETTLRPAADAGMAAQDTSMLHEPAPAKAVRDASPGKREQVARPGKAARVPKLVDEAPTRSRAASGSADPGEVSCSSLETASAPACSRSAQIVAALREAKISYYVPLVMVRGERRRVSLVLDTSEVSRIFAMAARAEEGASTLLRHISARVRGGAAFDVDPPELQQRELSGESQARWAWTIVPVQAGQERLTLEVVLVLNQEAGAASEPLVVRTISDAVRVEDTASPRMNEAQAALTPLHLFVVALAGSLCALSIGLRRNVRRLAARRWRPKSFTRCGQP